MSGVPQGSVLGPICFIIYINSIDKSLTDKDSFISKFADDTKVGRAILSVNDNVILQNDLNALVDWSKTWKMQFNASKCKILHFGRTNPQHSYYMEGVELEKSDKEKDVGVLITNTLKPTSQCSTAAARANSVLGQMSRALSFRNKKTWIPLYKTYVRPHLEYCAQAWSPWTQHDTDLLENVQKRAVRMTSGLQGQSYEDKLSELGLTTLSERRIRGDLIMVWKILHNHDDVSYSTWFRLASSDAVQNTRLSSGLLNLRQSRFNSETRRHFFSQRVIEKWNNLPETVKNAPSVNSFKNNYDNWLKNQ